MYRGDEAPGPLLIIAFGEHVVAVQRRSGEIAWKHQEYGSGTPRLQVHGTSIILAYTCHFVCLDYTTGKSKWRTDVPRGGTDTLLVDGDELFFGDRGTAGCIDVKSGAVLWQHPFTGMGMQDVALGVPGNATQRDRF